MSSRSSRSGSPNAAPVLRRRNKSDGNGHDLENPWLAIADRLGFKPPIDVEQRLAAMAFQGPGESAIHPTQVSVSAALLTPRHAGRRRGGSVARGDAGGGRAGRRGLELATGGERYSRYVRNMARQASGHGRGRGARCERSERAERNERAA